MECILNIFQESCAFSCRTHSPFNMQFVFLFDWFFSLFAHFVPSTIGNRKRTNFIALILDHNLNPISNTFCYKYTIGNDIPISEMEILQDRDLESIASASTADDEIYDRKTLVKRTHGYEPDPHGGTERYRTEITTTTTMKGSSNF